MNLNSGRDFKNKIKKRNYVAFAIFILLFIGLLIRLAYVQLTEGPSLAVSADKQYYYEEYTDNLTFKLLDNNGESLFDYVTKFYVVIDPMTFYTLNDEKAFVNMRNIMYILRDYDEAYDISELQSELEKGNKSYEVDENTYNKIKEIKGVKGIYFYEYKDYDKVINSNIKNILANPIKVSSNNELKDEGTLENTIYKYVKNNKKDKIRFEKDVSKNIISEEVIVNEDNNNVVTTLDKDIQSAVEESLRNEEDSDFKDYIQIGAVLMESDSGRILSMAQKNDWVSNPNIGVTNNNGYLLGSTFKTIVYEAALENNLIKEDEVFEIDNIVDGFEESIELQDEYTIREAYIASSNKAFINIGWQIGVDKIYEMAKKQGLFNSVLGLQDEAVGGIDGYGSKENVDIITLTSIGQTARSTPVGALSIANTVINNGVYVKPRIIETITKNNGSVVDRFEAEKNIVLSEHTASVLKQSMIGVVNNELGTGKEAKIPGIEVGGKTGTTEYIDGDKELSDGWFVGFFEYNGKKYSMVVFIPHSGEVQGKSSIACRMFKNIVENLIDKNLLK